MFFWNKDCLAVLLSLFLSRKVINNRGNRITLNWFDVPLTESAEFKTILQKGNRIQLPRLIRRKFKLETSQILKVTVFPERSYTGECFYAQIDKSGRITIPALTRKLLENTKHNEQSLIGAVMEVKLEPA